MNEVIWWSVFGFIIITSLTIDLGIFHKKKHEVKLKEALIWSAVWIVLALLFCGGLYILRDHKSAITFLSGYLIEKSLSVDNLFVFIMIFSYFGIPNKYHHVILFFGILGAIIFRCIFIVGGVVLFNAFHWMIYIFGAFLVLTGIKMMLIKAREVHPEKNIVLKLVKKLFPVSTDFHEGRFFVKIDKKIFATPLFVALVLIESSDVMFAVDSVPAILAITQDIFIVYTSNIFAILGLRALYFALAGLMKAFKYLKHGVSFLLIYVGVKMSISKLYKIQTEISLAIIAITIALSVLVSVYSNRKNTKSVIIELNPEKEK